MKKTWRRSLNNSIEEKEFMKKIFMHPVRIYYTKIKDFIWVEDARYGGYGFMAVMLNGERVEAKQIHYATEKPLCQAVICYYCKVSESPRCRNRYDKNEYGYAI